MAGRHFLQIPGPTNVPERTESASEPTNGGSPDSGSGREYVSFEDSFETELREEFGDLGPVTVQGAPGDRDRSDRGPRRDGGGGDRDRRPRRRTR